MERRWPTLRERLARRDDIIDDSLLRVRPSPEEIEALGKEAEAWLVERGLPLHLQPPPAEESA